MPVKMHKFLSLVSSGSLLFLILVPLALTDGISPFTRVFWLIYLTVLGVLVGSGVVVAACGLTLGHELVVLRESRSIGTSLSSCLAHWMLARVALLLLSVWPWHAYWAHHSPYDYVIPNVSILFGIMSAMTYIRKLEFARDEILFHTLLGFHYAVHKRDLVSIFRIQGRPYFTYVRIRSGWFSYVMYLPNPLTIVQPLRQEIE